MADAQAPTPAAAPVSALPLHVSQDQSHVPAVSSPLNPDVKTRPTKAAAPREQRERKESQKKRESTAAGGPRGTTPTLPSKRKASSAALSAPSPMRFQIAEPRIGDYDPPKPTVFVSHEPLPFLTPNGATELKKPADHAENKRGYRYSQCVADPQFRHKQYYRQSEALPYGARMSFEDTDKWVHYDTTGKYITNEKGWRAARANVCAREGTLYYEVRIVRGVPAEGPAVPVDAAGPQPHIRMGWARREAPLDAPIGFDGYSYAVTDTRFETMHRSRPGKFFHPKQKGKPTKKSAGTKQENTPVELNDHIREGDIVGLEIQLPSLALHQKVVSGIYNPAVDMGDGFDTTPPNPDPNDEPCDIIRDRIPVPYKGNVYFETMDYITSKYMEAYADRNLNLSTLSSPGPGATSIIKQVPNANHVEPSLRTLPHSCIRTYKNGKLVGTAFENLLAFLPPASAPSKAQGAREGFDDGMLGYFPAVAAFSGGIAEVNFGDAGFWMPPAHLKKTASRATTTTTMTVGADTVMEDAAAASANGDLAGRYYPGRALRPIGERFGEQIAEDVVWDIIDEVDFFMQDGGFGGKVGAGAGGAKRGVASLKEEVD
ncbi:hypothetical protein MBLNU459_g3300t1 [Dothideomycetes sp. NU459]